MDTPIDKLLAGPSLPLTRERAEQSKIRVCRTRTAAYAGSAAWASLGPDCRRMPPANSVGPVHASGYRDGSGVHQFIKRLKEKAKNVRSLSGRLRALAETVSSVKS